MKDEGDRPFEKETLCILTEKIKETTQSIYGGKVTQEEMGVGTEKDRRKERNKVLNRLKLIVRFRTDDG